MAASLQPVVQAMVAAAALNRGEIVTVSAANGYSLATKAGNAGKGQGVVVTESVTTGDVTEVAVDGGALIKAAASINAGQSIASNASGLGRPAVAGEWAIGVAQSAAAAGDLFPVIIGVHQLDA